MFFFLCWYKNVCSMESVLIRLEFTLGWIYRMLQAKQLPRVNSFYFLGSQLDYSIKKYIGTYI